MAEKNDSRTGGSVERSSEEIRSDIAARRESISHTVGQLGEKLHDTLDWRGYVARYPYAAVGLAVGTGVLIGRLLKRKSSPRERLVDALVEKASELGEGIRDSVQRIIMRTAGPSLFRGTIYGIAGKALMQYLQDRAAHVEGNGGSFSHQEWGEIRHTPNAP
jgi:ElaB/YqjD/DUF883 family membrane-anchored ribosome-binding protein